jgi:hypothetical protein
MFNRIIGITAFLIFFLDNPCAVTIQKWTGCRARFSPDVLRGGSNHRQTSDPASKTLEALLQLLENECCSEIKSRTKPLVDILDFDACIRLKCDIEKKYKAARKSLCQFYNGQDRDEHASCANSDLPANISDRTLKPDFLSKNEQEESIAEPEEIRTLINSNPLQVCTEAALDETHRTLPDGWILLSPYPRLSGPSPAVACFFNVDTGEVAIERPAGDGFEPSLVPEDGEPAAGGWSIVEGLDASPLRRPATCLVRFAITYSHADMARAHTHTHCHRNKQKTNHQRRDATTCRPACTCTLLSGVAAAGCSSDGVTGAYGADFVRGLRKKVNRAAPNPMLMSTTRADVYPISIVQACSRTPVSPQHILQMSWAMTPSGFDALKPCKISPML